MSSTIENGRRAALAASGLLAFGALTQPHSAGAQDASDGELQEVRVTGSRVVRDGFEAPTPVKVVSSEELAEAAPTSLSDALNQLPEFKNSLQPQNTGIGTTANAGQSFLNLRSLGAERTLILLDGRRIVPSTATGTTDISLIPDGLVKRVDVVTGGASAAYGSDAVAGIVNFVLDTEFTGLKMQAQYGTSDRNDADNHRVSVTGGTKLFGGRGHLLGSASLYKNNGITRNGDREWFQSCSRIANPALVPNQIIECDVRAAQFARGGLIPSGPLRGTEFGPGGVPQQFVYGSQLTTNTMIGGSGEDFALDYQLIPAVARKNAFARFSYDITDNVSAFVEGLYGTANADYNGTSSWQGQATAYTIYRDNAFLPASTRAAMVAGNINSFSLARYDVDFGPLEVDGRNKTERLVAGIDAKFGEWTFNAYYEHGENAYRQRIHNNSNINRLYNAADAVVNPANGQIVCRSTLTQPTNGCVPLNVFGYGSPSAAALDWVLGTTVQDLDVQQKVFEASLAGSPFATWAGDVSVAFGVGWREESSDQQTDDVSQSMRTFTGGYQGWPTSVAFTGQVGGWERNNPLPLKGEYDVKEAFLETVLPLLSGVTLADRLELNGAVRYTDYSTSGGVTSWKAGLIYAPFSELRLRATRSRDIRAPNLNEMFRGPVNGQSNLIDPFQPVGSPNRNPFVLGSSFGNPDLKPEVGDTTAVGFVYEPSWFEGFTASVDYYDIELDGAITSLGGQRTLDQCFAGTTSLCQYLTRDANGVLIATQSPFLNIASRTTSGYDVELAYRTPASRFVSNLGGNFTIRAFANYISKLTTTTPGAATLDDAGQNGGGGVPDLAATLSVRYDSGPVTLYAQQRFISDGALDKTLTAAALAPEDNKVASVTYTDFTATFRPTLGGLQEGTLEAFFSVSNVFDRDPPLAPGAFFVFGTSHTNTSLYDVVGRAYSLGMRYRF